MKNKKTELALIVTLWTLSSGILSANSLYELREHYGQQDQRQSFQRKTPRDVRTVVEKRRYRDGRVTKTRTVKIHARDRRSGTRSNMHQKEIRTKHLAQARRAAHNIDRRLNRKTAKRRHFRSLKEFRSKHRPAVVRQARRTSRQYGNRGREHFSSVYRGENRRYRGDRNTYRWQAERYGNGWDRDWGYAEQWRPRHVQRGHRHSRRNWYLTYRYERASFYDRHGYRYGYFSRRGFMFEGEFYRYDRYYSYRDRVRGRGLFERRYYRPAYSRYGNIFADIDRDWYGFYASLR